MRGTMSASRRGQGRYVDLKKAPLCPPQGHSSKRFGHCLSGTFRAYGHERNAEFGDIRCGDQKAQEGQFSSQRVLRANDVN